MNWKPIISWVFILMLASSQAISAQVQNSEILKITAEDNNLIIDVAKSYPKLNLKTLSDQNKIQIEFLDTKYHNSFKFDLSTKNKILEELNFAKDVSIGTVENQENSKVIITIDNSSELNTKPKLLSTKDNKIRIVFLNPEKNNNPGSLDLTNDSALIQKQIENEEMKTRYNLAIEEYAKENLETAEEIYKEIVSKDKDFYAARYNLAKIYFDRQNYDMVLDELSSLIEEIKIKNESEKNKKLLLLAKNILGSIYFYKEDYKTALEQFNEITLLDPSFSEAYFNIGIVKEKEKVLSEAITNFEKAQELNPSNPETHYHLGILNLLTGNKDSAISSFKKVTELTNENNKLAELSKLELKKLEKR